MERSVFISYSREDSPQVLHDAELLRAGGVRVFIDVCDSWRDQGQSRPCV